MEPGVAAGHGRPASFDTSVAHVARVYNYWLGGKDYFAAGQAAGEQAIKAFPDIVLSACANRAFLARAVRFLAGEVAVRGSDGDAGLLRDVRHRRLVEPVAEKQRRAAATISPRRCSTAP